MIEPRSTEPRSGSTSSNATANAPSGQWEPEKASPTGLLAVRKEIEEARAEIAAGNGAHARAILSGHIERLEAEVAAGGSEGDVHRQLLVPVLYSVLGQAFDAEGRVDEARAQFLEALARFNSLPAQVAVSGTYRSDLGVALDAVGEDGEALLREVFETGEATPEACRRLALRRLDRGDLDGAERALRQSLELSPDDLRSWSTLSEVLTVRRQPEQAAAVLHEMSWRLVAHGRLEEALAAADRALELLPGNADAEQARGEALRLLGRLDEAIAAFDRCLHVEPANRFALASKGAALASAGRDAEAVESLARAIELEPAYFFALAWRGGCLDRLGRLEEAEADFERAAEIEPHSTARTELGTVRMRGGDLDGALSAFEQALAVDGANVAALLGEAEVLVRLGRYEQSIDVARAALAVDESLPTAHALIGEALRMLDHPADSLRAFDRAIALDPDYAFALGSRGQALLSLGRSQAAFDDLKRADELAPDTAWILVSLSQSLSELERFEESYAVAERAAELSSDATALRVKGAALLALQRYDEGLAVLERGTELHPQDAALRIVLAQALSTAGRFEEAEVAYLTAASLAPENPRPLSLLALMLDGRGQVRLRDALQFANDAVSRSAEDTFALTVRGRMMRRMGRCEEALADLERVVDRDDAPDWVFSETGEALRLLGRYAEAIEAADRALAVEPSSTFVRGTKAAALFGLDRDEEALALIDEALADDPSYLFALRLRGRIQAWNNRIAEALESYEQALAVDPDDVATLLAKGGALEQAGRYAEALAVYDRALDLEPANVDAQFSRGDVLRFLSRFGEAEEALERVLAARPDDVPATRSWGWVLIGEKRYRDAEQAFLRAQTLSPGDPLVCFDLAVTYRLLEQHALALEIGKRSLVGTTDPKVIYYYADLLSEVGRYLEALETVERALQLDGSQVDFWTMKAWAMEYAGEPLEGALEAYDSALARDEHYAFARMGRAVLRRELRDPGFASDFEVALDSIRANSDADATQLAAAGWCLYGLRRYDEAVEQLLNVRASSPELLFVQFDLALTMLSRGQVEPAVREYERGVAELISKHPLHRQGLVKVATHDLERERRANDDLARHDHSIARIVTRLDLALAAAEAECGQVASLDPN